MAKGRPADYDLLAQDERLRLREQANGDEAAYKRLLMHALRAAKKRRAALDLAQVGDPVAPAGQLHFAGEAFDLELYDRNHKNELRRRCQTDLAFLCKDIMGRDVTEWTHGPVFAFLGNPDPDRPFEAQLDPIRERIWRDPRGTFKTSILTDLAVQYTICFPEIRILFLGGEKTLAAGVLDTYTETFVLRGAPTRFQRLFPEFCIAPGEKYEKKFVAPCRKNPKRSKEPTAWSNSVDSALSGWHPDLLIPDDVENDENMENLTRISKVKKIFYQAMQLLEPVAGRMFNGGTRYHTSDLGGELMRETSDKRRSLVRPALRARPELPEARRKELEAALRDPNVPSADFREADWELLFPERLTFKNLMAERGPSLEKFSVFGSQKLNDPVMAMGKPTFVMDELRALTVPPNVIPAQGRIFLLWDLAYKVRRGRDFYVGGVGLVDANERLFIPEIVRGRFVTHEIVYHIVDLARRWAPEITDIEDTMGAQYLLSDLQRMAESMQVPLKIDWFPVDSSPDAKDGRVKSLESLVHQKRVFFSSTIGCLEELYQELCGYGNEAHDDIADVLSQLAVRHVHMLAEGMPAPENELDRAAEERRLELHDMIYRTGRYEPEAYVAPPPADPFALEDVMPGLDG
jgi:phage terminase large subunit-like protein